MNPKPQTNKQNNTPNNPDRCVVCGGLTLFRVYVEGKLLPCHPDCLVVLRQRESQLEAVAAVVSSVV